MKTGIIIIAPWVHLPNGGIGLGSEAVRNILTKSYLPYLHSCDFQVITQQLETRPVLRIKLPAHLQNQLEPLRTRRRYRRSKFAAAHHIHDGTLLHVLVRSLASEQLPKNDSKRPNIDLFRTVLLLNRFGSHPSHGSGKTHLCTDLVPGAGRSEVADFDDLVFTN